MANGEMSGMERNYDLYLKETQFRRKANAAYFFISKVGIYWLVFVLFMFNFFSMLIALVASMFTYLYLTKNHFNYLFFEKEKLFVIRLMKKVLGEQT